jgi:hypothetical protein
LQPKHTILDGRDLQSFAERFWRRVKKTKDCWLWQGPQTKGYGIVSGVFSDGPTKNMVAHRIAWELTNGPIPRGMTLDHLCRVRHCVRPDHLEIVTYKENALRGDKNFCAINARKTHCPYGHPYDLFNTVISYGKAKYGNTRYARRECRICIRNRYLKSRQSF